VAAPNLGQAVASAWETKVGRKPTDNIHDSYWLLHQFDKGNGYLERNGGRLCEVSLEFAINTTFKAYDDLETLDTTRVDVFDAAQYNWKQIAGTVTMSAKEVAFTQGEGGKFDLLAAKLENAKNSHDYEINRQMYTDGTGTGGKEIGGLELLSPTLPTTGSPGGINRATYTWWRSQTQSGAKTTAAYDNLRSSITACYNDCSTGVNNAHPTGLVSSQTIFQAYEGILVAVEQITDKRNADIAFKGENIAFKGAKFAFDEEMGTTASVYMWNTDFLKLAYQAGFWKKMYPPVDPSNQTADVYKILTICTLVALACRRIGKVHTIT